MPRTHANTMQECSLIKSNNARKQSARKFFTKEARRLSKVRERAYKQEGYKASKQTPRIYANEKAGKQARELHERV